MGSHTKLHYHFVFCTKFRESTIPPDKKRLFAYLRAILENLGAHCHTIGGVEDHLHLAAGLKPTHCVADVVRVLKANSSRWVHSEWPEFHDFRWQGGYGGFSVSHSLLPGTIEYIDQQERHHSRVSLEREYAMLLNRHGIDAGSGSLFEK